jgi:hypothetical protein
MEEAAIDCKNITAQTIVPLPLSLKAGNAIHVKKSVF